MRLTKKVIEEKAAEYIDRILSGGGDPLKQFILLKTELEALKIALSEDDVQSAVIDEIAKYGPHERRMLGAKFETGSTGAKYDFSEVGEWEDLANRIKELTQQKKDLEAGLKAQYRSKVRFASMEDGSEVNVKQVSMGGTTIKITFPKE